jgi:hypothetical protein
MARVIFLFNSLGKRYLSFNKGEDILEIDQSFYTLQVGIHILIFFLANLVKGNMSFCHHLVSVVCHPFTFHILIFSSENPQPNELKLGRKHYSDSYQVSVVAMLVN